MQLKIQRSQRAGGLTGSTVIFCLDIRADYSAEEADNIRRYRLGSQGIYNSRAAQRHLDRSGEELERTQSGDLKGRMAGLAKGAVSLALANLHLNVSIESLGKGHHIECKDLNELLEAEDTLRSACKNLTRYLDVANSFNGSELVVEYAGGEEQVHITQHAPPLITQAESVADTSGGEAYEGVDSSAVSAAPSGPPLWLQLLGRYPVYTGAAAIVLVVFVVAYLSK